MRVLNKAKKSLGQNFLIDKNIIKKIIEIGNIDKKKTIIEIGAGYGSLTKELASFNPKKIYAVEKDKKLVSFLKDKFKNHANIKIIDSDILSFLPRLTEPLTTDSAPPTNMIKPIIRMKKFTKTNLRKKSNCFKN